MVFANNQNSRVRARAANGLTKGGVEQVRVANAPTTERLRLHSALRALQTRAKKKTACDRCRRLLRRVYEHTQLACTSEQLLTVELIKQICERARCVLASNNRECKRLSSALLGMGWTEIGQESAALDRRGHSVHAARTYVLAMNNNRYILQAGTHVYVARVHGKKQLQLVVCVFVV